MKAKFITKDEKEIKRIAKSTDMAIFIFELKNNLWRQFKHTDYDYHIAWDKINELLDEFDININELID